MGQSADAMRYGREPDQGRPGGMATAGPAADETEQIEQEIEQTRAEMTATIDAIQQRLDPEQAKDSARDIADQVLQEAKAHAREVVQEAGEHAREVVRDATAHVQQAVHDATIGKVTKMVRTTQYRANEASEGFMTTLRANPIPAALAGIGLAWLYMNRRSTPSHQSSYLNQERGYVASGNWSAVPDYPQGGYTSGQSYGGGYSSGQSYGTGYRQQQSEGNIVSRAGEGIGSAASQVGERASGLASQVGDTAGNVASQVGDTAGNVASRVGETASNLTSAVGETASNLTSQAQYRAQRLEDRFQESLQTNPLAVGAVALALGAAAGLVLPQTQRENQLMGEARDTLVERAQGMAQETIEKVQNVATEVGSTVQETVKQEAQSQGLVGSQGGSGSRSS